MATELVRQLSPEEEELIAKREELAQFEAHLAEQELLLVNLKAELTAFNGLYLRRVGILYSELDEWNARLAELRAHRAATPEARTEAAEARSQAHESYSAAHGEAACVQPFLPSHELKRLFREAAKKVHPDIAIDEADRARRERLMQQVNAAYAAGDEDALRRTLTDLDASPDAVQGSGIAADLIRVLRQLKQLKGRIAAIELEIANIAESDLAKLKAKVDLAFTKGRDLLGEMGANIQDRIKMAQQQFEAESTERSDK